MKIITNGEAMEVRERRRQPYIVKAVPYRKGAIIVITKGISSTKKRTNEYEVLTAKGSMTIRLNETQFADRWEVIDISDRRSRGTMADIQGPFRVRCLSVRYSDGREE